MLTVFALATIAAATSGDSTEVREIIVTGELPAFAPRRSATATRTDTDLLNVPQSVNVVSARQIRDQAMHGMADVLRAVPGVSMNGGEGHRDHIVIRGNGSTADFFLDGLRDDVQFYRGLYNVERVEILKGPNAMIFGRGGGGGVVNRVTKRAERKRFARLAISGDSEGAGDFSADIEAPFGRTLSARLNAVGERLGNFRDVFSGHRFGFNPTVAWQPDDDTRLDMSVEYDRDRRVVDRGVPSARPGTPYRPAPPLAGFDSTFFGQRGTNRARFTSQVATAAFEHRFSPALRIVARGLLGDYDKFYRNAQPATPVTVVNSNRSVGIEAYQQATRRKSALGQVEAIVDVATGPVRHQIVVGIDAAHQRSDNVRLQGFFDGSVATANGGQRVLVPLAATIAIPAITFRSGANDLGHNDAIARGDALGVYVQDQANIADLVTVVAGLRRDRFELTVDDHVAGATFARTDHLWSPRLGVVFTPANALSFYGSYSRSFLPQSGDQFGALTATLAALEPERFVNREVGAKWRPLSRLDLTAALYRLDRTNTRAIDPVSGTTVLSGAQRSEGIEFSAVGQVGRALSLSSGAAWQRARITSSTAAAPVGRTVALVPRFQASFWGRYDFSRRFGLGVGATHQSSTFATISNSVLIPAWTRIDGAVFARLSGRFDLQLNLENAFDRHYIAAAGSDNNLSPGNRRTLRATLRGRF